MEQSSIFDNKSKQSTPKQRIIANKEGIIVWGALVLNMILVFIQRLYIGVFLITLKNLRFYS